MLSKSIIIAIISLVSVSILSVNAQSRRILGRPCNFGTQMCDKNSLRGYYSCYRGKYVYKRCSYGTICARRGRSTYCKRRIQPRNLDEGYTQ
ncbi:hypothetical protein AYI70_g4491 [Smittium culicis]|uniref:Uncharacterized protein n=1 Tax=Smittium culicis TaxID=133412 RepID=A0A1R1XYQ9_9FUNG|nr:hypothetical protein AYI70_g4491 [Smittium culicis]